MRDRFKGPVTCRLKTGCGATRELVMDSFREALKVAVMPRHPAPWPPDPYPHSGYDMGVRRFSFERWVGSVAEYREDV